MCGVWGVMSSWKTGLMAGQVSLLEDLAKVGVQRGADGTGMFWAKTDGISGHYKKAGNPFWLLFDKTFNKDVRPILEKDAKFVVGHNRAATKGLINDANTHPFCHGPITLVHNGTINSGLDVPNDGTDSEEICKALASDEGVKVFGRIYGAWTAIWYDERDKKLRFLLNGLRPLAMVKSHAGDIYFASKLKMLEWIMDEHKYGIKSEVFLKTDVIYAFDLETLECAETPAPAKKYQSYSTYPPGNQNWHNTTGSNVHQLPNYKKKRGRYMKLTNQEAMFTIRKIFEEKPNAWRHEGITDRKEALFFYSNRPLYEMMNNTYAGELSNVFVENDIPWLQVKFRSIELLEEGCSFFDSAAENEVPSEEEQKALREELKDLDDSLAPLTYVKLADKGYYSRSNIAKGIIRNQGRCMSCATDLSDESIKIDNCYPIKDKTNDTMIIGFLCPTCTDKSNKHIPHTPVNTLQ